MPAGFLYVLINQSMPGLAKVGKTTRDPSNRVAELSSATGVPSPFMLAFQQPVAECDSAEIWVHRELERRGYRHADNREFFNAPLHEIVQIVVQIANLTPIPAEETSVPQSEHTNMASPERLAKELFGLACQYRNGTDNVLMNEKKALELFEQAGALGDPVACLTAGQYYEFGSAPSIPKNADKALTYYQKAVQLGLWATESNIAELFQGRGQEAAAKTHWNIFFEQAREKLDRAPDKLREIFASETGSNGRRYCEAVSNGEIAACVPVQVISNLAEILLRSIDSRISEVAKHPNKLFAGDMVNRLQTARRYVKGTMT